MVADTKTQKRYKLTTNATTLGELKQTLAANAIDYSGMSFTEGITKTTLTEDDFALPTNIPYKGKLTNNLVILLTNTRKNISSGMDRKEAYNLVKSRNLQEEVKDKFGRNFTQVPTASLEEFLCGCTSPSSSEEEKESAVESAVNKEEANDGTGCLTKEQYESCVKVLKVLTSHLDGITSNLHAIITLLKEYVPEPEFEVSDDEIDDMLAEI